MSAVNTNENNKYQKWFKKARQYSIEGTDMRRYCSCCDFCFSCNIQDIGIHICCDNPSYWILCCPKTLEVKWKR